MDDKHPTGEPDSASNTRIADLKHRLKIVKAVKAVVVLVVLVVGTVLPLIGVGMPWIDLPSVHLPSFGFMDRAADADLPGWADRALDVLKKVKNGVIALLVLAAVFGEHERRQRASAADGQGDPDQAEPHHAEPHHAEPGQGEPDREPERTRQGATQSDEGDRSQ